MHRGRSKSAAEGRKQAAREEVPGVDTAHAIERFLESPALSDGTRRAYRGDLEEFADWLRARRLTLDAVDARVFSEYAAVLEPTGRGVCRESSRRRRSPGSSPRSARSSALRSGRRASPTSHSVDGAAGGFRTRRNPRRPTR